MNPLLNLNTGKLLNATYITQTDLQTTLPSVVSSVITERIDVIKESNDSDIKITLFLKARGQFGNIAAQSLRISVYRNTPDIDVTTPDPIYSELFAFFIPNATRIYSFSFSFIDTTPASGSTISTESIYYNVVFTVDGFVGGVDSLQLQNLELLSFEEIENPEIFNLSTPLMPTPLP